MTELLLVDPAADPGLWQVRGSLLAAVERVLIELDVEQRARRRAQWQQEAAAQRRPATAAALKLRDTSRQVVEQPRRRRRERSGPS